VGKHTPAAACGPRSLFLQRHSDIVSLKIADFKSIEDQFNLLRCPFSFNVEEASDVLQLELIDLQADLALKETFKNMKLSEFCSSISTQKFGNLKNFARKMFVFFASTYICEQTFSCMNINKSKNRSLLTDSNLHSVLRRPITTSRLNPDYTKLVQDCGQLHKSH